MACARSFFSYSPSFFLDSEVAANIQGDFYYLTGSKGEFYTSGIRRFVGGLPIWWRIQWLAGSFELAAFICLVCVILIFAVAIERFSAHRANRLLSRTFSDGS